MAAKITIARICSVLCVITLLLSVTPLQAAHAAGVRYAKPDGTGDCSSWANACILQTALSGAVSGDEIWVAAGVFKPTTITTLRTATFQLKNGVAVYGGFVGTETARDQRNPTVNVTILSGDIDNNDSQTPIITNFATVTGNTTNSYHVVTGATGASLDGFTITAGYANAASPNDDGGGMYNESSSPTLTNVTFSGNSASYIGGGMDNESSSPTLTNVTFYGNFAGYGGGMFNDNSNPILTNVTFSGNHSAPNGGGMYNASFSSPTLTDVTFSGNGASNNGGGMYNDEYSNPTLMNVAFSGNLAPNGGAGMYNDSSGPTLTNVTFSGNMTIPSDGGGIYNSSSYPTLTNVTFSSNSASEGGGMYDFFSSPTLTNVTFSSNSASEGGGIYDDDSSIPQIRNTIFWGNKQAQIYNADAGSTPGVSYSIVQGGCPSGSTCTNIITADPKLGTLGNYGGFTQTIPILPGSSAIDTGYDTTCPATDQRGVTRPQGAHCDIGAFESQPFTLTIIGGNNQNALINTAFAAPLALSVGGTNGDPVDGGMITFTPPSSGASAALASNPATITGGAVSDVATANGTSGAYDVSANASGVVTPAAFHLTNLLTLPTNTPTTTPTATGTSTQTVTLTPTATPTGTSTQTATLTPTLTSTGTSTQTVTLTPTMTPTGTSTQTVTLTPTMTPTGTSTQTATLTPTMTPTSTSTQTATLTPTLTSTGTSTQTVTLTITLTASLTTTATSTPTLTATPPAGSHAVYLPLVIKSGSAAPQMAGGTGTHPSLFTLIEDWFNRQLLNLSMDFRRPVELLLR